MTTENGFWHSCHVLPILLFFLSSITAGKETLLLSSATCSQVWTNSALWISPSFIGQNLTGWDTMAHRLPLWQSSKSAHNWRQSFLGDMHKTFHNAVLLCSLSCISTIFEFKHTHHQPYLTAEVHFGELKINHCNKIKILKKIDEFHWEVKDSCESWLSWCNLKFKLTGTMSESHDVSIICPVAFFLLKTTGCNCTPVLISFLYTEGQEKSLPNNC